MDKQEEWAVAAYLIKHKLCGALEMLLLIRVGLELEWWTVLEVGEFEGGFLDYTVPTPV